jgi:anti-sigma B factor antagonist
MLNINKSIEGSKAVFNLEGRLDTVTAPDLEKEIKDCVDSLTEMELNFAGLEYISSAGLRVLLATHKTMSKSGQLKIVNVNDTIMEIFEVTGFSDILTIE